MLENPAVIGALGTAIAAILGGIGAVLLGLRKLTAANAKALEEENVSLRAKLEVSRKETDVARAYAEHVRDELTKDVEEERAGRRADRLQHEADMQHRTRELGGRP